MRNIILVLSITLFSMLIQGCSGTQETIEVKSSNCCAKKCERKYLLKNGYQKAKNIDQCKRHCP